MGSRWSRLRSSCHFPGRGLLELGRVNIRPEVARFLDRLTAAAVETAVSADGTMPLELSAYVAARLPPPDLVTSVRSLLFRDLPSWW